MPKKITNPNYRKFLDEGVIEPISEAELKIALRNAGQGKHGREARALLIALYYTGARPNEVLDMKAKDVKKDKSYVLVNLPASKGGLPRTLYLQYSNKLVKELYKYATGVFPDMLMFYHFRSSYERVKKLEDGTISKTEETTDKLRYHVQKWFIGIREDSITPYFLRHSRMSKLAREGATMQQLRMLKGSKTTESVMPYLHLSSQEAKELARKIK